VVDGISVPGDLAGKQCIELVKFWARRAQKNEKSGLTSGSTKFFFLIAFGTPFCNTS
jgi:hypothetical protein